MSAQNDDSDHFAGNLLQRVIMRIPLPAVLAVVVTVAGNTMKVCIQSVCGEAPSWLAVAMFLGLLVLQEGYLVVKKRVVGNTTTYTLTKDE